jgi:tetratricopeptide (TPR) repeat protein
MVFMTVGISAAPSHTLYYWGEGGQYGPFDVQQNGEWAGWPNFGQVMRYFRKRVRPKLSAKAFGVLYGQTVNADGSAVGERWILEMELENKVPVDLNKRKTIARLLHIPPMLFGLAILEDMTLQPHPQAPQIAARGQTKLARVAIDTSKYQSNVRTLWQLHDTGNAQSALDQLEADIRDLAGFEQQTRGDLRYHIQEILFGYQLLATHIVRDQRRFRLSYDHANEAVRVAKSMHDSDLLATALFTRGWTRLEWGLYGVMKDGVFQVQQGKLEAAIRDFEAAKKVFPAQDGKGGMHPQLLGRLLTYKSRAWAALTASKGEDVPASVLLTPDDAADLVGYQDVDDLYTRTLVTGTRSGLHMQAYLSNRASIFTAAKLPGQALQELNAAERLTEKTYRRDETRQFAWLDILKANIYIELGEFAAATDYARRALLACQDISSITNIAIITDIYGRLRQSNYKSSGDVRELGDILRNSSLKLI